MDAGKSVPGNKSAEKDASLSFVQGAEGQSDLPAQERGNDAPLIQARSSDKASLLSAASPPGRHVSIIDGHPAATSVTATNPITTTTTNSTIYPTTTTTTTPTTTTNSAIYPTTTATVSSTRTTAPQPRVVFLQAGDVTLNPVWDHYQKYAMLIHGILYSKTCGYELVRQVVRIPCTTESYPPDDEFAAGFVAVVEGAFASDASIGALDKEMNAWWHFQKKTTSAQGQELSVWIGLFTCALMVAKAMAREGGSAGVQDSAVNLNKLRSRIDNRRKELVQIHLGDPHQNDTSMRIRLGNASSEAKAQATPHKRRRAGSMTALFPSASPEGGKKALPQLPREELAGFESKEKALLGWKKKADKKFDKHQVDRSVLRFFEQCFEAFMRDCPDLYCIAYKFVALTRFAEAVRGIAIRDALVEETDNELGYVNEILLFRERLKAVVRSGSGALPEDSAYYRIWLDFFQQVSVLMDFRRSNRETALSESPEMNEILIKGEIAYANVVKKMREADELRQKQDEDAQARRKADRAKERRLKGRSMDFLMPSKEKRAAQPSASLDTDVIGQSPRKKIARQDRQQEGIPDQDLPARTKAGMDMPVLQYKKGTRKNLPVAESLPDSGSSATGQPTTPKGVSRPKKKPARFEARQQEAGPVRAGEEEKAKPKAIRHEPETNTDAREIGEGDKPAKAGKGKKEAKQEQAEQIEKMGKKSGKTTRGTKDD